MEVVSLFDNKEKLNRLENLQLFLDSKSGEGTGRLHWPQDRRDMAGGHWASWLTGTELLSRSQPGNQGWAGGPEPAIDEFLGAQEFKAPGDRVTELWGT